MAKYKNEVSAEVIDEADKIAKATQRPGQTKEQTKLIAQGIQKGIEQYKKKHKAKARELDKKLKSIKLSGNKITDNQSEKNPKTKNIQSNRFSMVPWFLLVLSWTYFYLTSKGII